MSIGNRRSSAVHFEEMSDMRLILAVWLFVLGGLVALQSPVAASAAERGVTPVREEADETEAEVDPHSADEPAPESDAASEEATSSEPAPLPVAEDDAAAMPANDSADQTDEDGTMEGSAPAESADEGDGLAPPPPSGSLLDRMTKKRIPVDRPKAATFQTIRVGESTAAELHKAWGAPLESAPQNEVLRETYRLDALGRVDVQIFRDTVQSITVHYDQHPKWAQLSTELGMDKLDAVEIDDEFGERMGLALPENGVMVALESGSRERRVSEVIYEPVDSQAFVLRAERRMDSDYTACLRDLEQALVVDSQCARAYWLRARVLQSTGQIDSALKAVTTALAMEPKNPQFRLTHSALLAASGQFAKAIDETKQALAQCMAQPELRAYATNQLGEQMAASPERAFKAAVPMHLQAIKLAEPLVEDRRTAVRHMAQEVLVTAHLAAARNIAWGNWKMKKKMVPVWLNRAEELARDMAANDGAAPDIAFRVCREALAACAGMEGDLDPTPWVDKAMTLAESTLAATKDPIRRRQVDWELGSALYDAVQVYHTKGELQQALKYGTLAVQYLEAGAEERHLEPLEAFLLGRLYYRMGALEAAEHDDAEKAVIWYERAIPLLERPLPATSTADAGRHGESFVSMAVSYWSVSSHDEALRLTRHGLKLMEQAVKSGTLDAETLRIPYTNLATMHKFLGDDEQAEAFSNLAAKASSARQK